MSDESMREWIDGAEYETLLAKWRNAPVGSPWFQGEIGQYYSEAMSRKRDEVGNAAHVAASKHIGWDG